MILLLQGSWEPSRQFSTRGPRRPTYHPASPLLVEVVEVEVEVVVEVVVTAAFTEELSSNIGCFMSLLSLSGGPRVIPQKGGYVFPKGLEDSKCTPLQLY